MSTVITVTEDVINVNVTEETVTVNASNGPGPAGHGVPAGGTAGQILAKINSTNYNTQWIANTDLGLTSVGISVPTGLTVTNSPLTANGVIALGLAAGYSVPTTASQSTWNTAYNDSIVSAAVTGTTTKTLTLNQQDAGTITASWTDINTDAVNSVFGRTGSVVAANGDYTTTQVTEGTNLYFTQGRFDTDFAGKSTTDLIEGTNLYYTSARSRAAISESATGLDYNNTSGVLSLTTGYSIPTDVNLAHYDTAYNDSIVSAAVTGTTTKTLTLTQQDAGTVTASWTDINTDAVSSVFGRTGAITATSGDYDTTKVTEGTNLYYTQGRFDAALAAKSTTNLTEGTNLYYTEARVNANTNVAANTAARHNAVTLGTTNGLSLSTQALSLGLSSSVANGALSATDWNTFNNKEGAVTSGTTAQYYRGDKTFQTLNTSVVPESSNLYFTNGRAQSAITGTAPIVLTSGVVSITQSGGASNGYLSSTDYNTFNAKQAALSGTGFVKIAGSTISYDNSTYLTSIAGIAAGGELSGTYTNPSLVNSAVIGKVLTGVNITGGTVVDTDTVLSAFGKLQNQINGLIGGSIYKGTWNASTNTPALVSSVGTNGNYYIVSVAGTTNLNGISDWQLGDWAIFNGGTWQKVDNSDSVSSVNGFTGAVSLTTANISEATNLYFTSARAIVAPLTGYVSGAGTVAATDTILGAIQKINGNVSGLVTGVSSAFGRTGAVVATSGDYTTTQVTEGTNLYYTDTRARASNSFVAGSGAYNATTGVITIPTNNNQITNGASFIALTGLSGGTGISYNNTTGVITSTITQYTDALARAAVSLTTTGTSGAATYNNTTGVLNIPAYVGGVTSAFGRTGAVVATSGDYTTSLVTEGTNLYYTEARVTANTNVSANTAARHNAVTIGTANGLSLSTQALSMALASTTLSGALSSTDWNTFNGKQATISVTTTGTSGAATLTGTTINIPNYGSALSSYLPLSGGTLSGALSGTSATFSATVNSNSTGRAFSTETATNVLFSNIGGAFDVLFGDGAARYYSLHTPTGASTMSIRNYSSSLDMLTFTSTGEATFSSSVTMGTAAGGTMLQVGTSSPSGYGTPTAIQMDNSYQSTPGNVIGLKFYLFKNGTETYGFGMNNAGGVEYHTGGYHGFYTATSGTATERMRITSGGTTVFYAPIRLKGYTVSTLPSGTQGDTAFVTDALTATYMMAVTTGGGSIVTKVFYNGTAWIAQ